VAGGEVAPARLTGCVTWMATADGDCGRLPAHRGKLLFIGIPKFFRNPAAPGTKMGYQRTTNESWKE
jgi:hypothetical protein